MLKEIFIRTTVIEMQLLVLPSSRHVTYVSTFSKPMIMTTSDRGETTFTSHKRQMA